MLRQLSAFLIAVVIAAPALAADEVETGPIPSWVVPTDVPSAQLKSDVAIEIILLEQQVRMEPGVTNAFSRQRIRINTREGLDAANLALQWRAGVDRMVVHQVNVIRAGKRIDLLSAGQKFTVLRREANLENGVLDGVLTATLQPEGVQAGDEVELLATLTSREPVLGAHNELGIALPSAPIARLVVAAHWPDSMTVQTRVGDGFPPLALKRDKDGTGFRMSIDNVQPIKVQAAVPIRFPLSRRLEISSFKDWSEVGAVLAPLFVKAAVISPSGPLRAEVDRIRAASSDPVRRAELALALVQDQLRYVALAMGSGNLVPEQAEVSFARRYGDCKAKTALLLAVLGELGIKAIPVAVNTLAGDGTDIRLPMVQAFNHVLVRADIDGRSFWLDGTRSGDRSIAALTTPDYRWGLELIPSGGKLVAMRPAPSAQPLRDIAVEADASGGLLLPAKMKVTLVQRGDLVGQWRTFAAGTQPADREKGYREFLQQFAPGVKFDHVISTFEDSVGQLRIEGTGTATLDWQSGVKLQDGIAKDIAPEREPGLYADAPVVLDYPDYSRTRWKVTLPKGFAARNKTVFAPVNATVGGTEYRRTATWSGDSVTVESSQRVIVPEVSLAEAKAAKAALTRLAGDLARLKAPEGYAGDPTEAKRLAEVPVGSNEERLNRAYKLMNNGRPDLALADLNAVIKEEPANDDALANRGITYIWMREFDKAEADFALVDKLQPEHPVLWRGRGLRAMMEEDWSGALKAFDRALKVDDDDEWTYKSRASVYLGTGQFDEALADAARLKQLKGDTPALRLFRAQVFQMRGESSRAVEELAPLSGETDKGVQGALAQMYRRIGRYEESAAALAKAYGASPSAPDLLNRALARPLSDRAGRRADLDAYILKEPTSPNGLAMLGSMLEDEGRYTEAVKLYTKGMAALTDGRALRFRRGIALVRAGKPSEGRKDILAGTGPDLNSTELNNRCWSLALAGIELDFALQQCEAALKKKPGNSAYLDSRAMVYLKQGKLDLALVDYDRALAKGPRGTSLMGRSFVHARMGDKVKAATDRQAAERLDAELPALFATYGLKD